MMTEQASLKGIIQLLECHSLTELRGRKKKSLSVHIPMTVPRVNAIQKCNWCSFQQEELISSFKSSLLHISAVKWFTFLITKGSHFKEILQFCLLAMLLH